jgi:Fur family transcriptional regulator, ferric uptake regulator
MSKLNEKSFLENYLKSKKLSFTKERFQILNIIFSKYSHFKVDDILQIIKNENLNISRATLYRTIDIFLKAGLIQKYVDADNVNFYEHSFGHKHHDHLICISCNKIIEFYNDSLEIIQNEICDKYKFKHVNHILKINGLCNECTTLYNEVPVMRLSNLKDNEKAKIIKIEGRSKFKNRLLEMGFVKGEVVEREKCAPLADPVEYIIKNYHVSLRKEEADDIIVENVKT